MHILVTGAAGFIGFHLARRLATEGHSVVGLDNMNDYYDVLLKDARLAVLKTLPSFRFEHIDISDAACMHALFTKERFTHAAHLAAQAGVRYSLKNPQAYIQSNLVGMGHILEGCRNTGVQHLVYASSSSVYGLNTAQPFATKDNVDHPISLYAATKKANELMAHSYAHLYALPCTGLRFFTVYGPWGRPDMALHLFTAAILAGKPIQVFNNGDMCRDFTYIDDIVEGVVRTLARIPQCNPDWDAAHPDPSTSAAPWRVYNIGNNVTVRLGDFIALLEEALGVQAIKEYLPLQPGDVPATWANIDDLQRDIGFMPNTPLKDGIAKFVTWYREYYI